MDFVFETLMLAIQRTRVVAGKGDRRFLVLQHEEGSLTGCRAWRTKTVAADATLKKLPSIFEAQATFHQP